MGSTSHNGDVNIVIEIDGWQSQLVSRFNAHPMQAHEDSFILRLS